MKGKVINSKSLAYVDLSRDKVFIEDVDEEDLLNFIGGKGLAVKILYKEVKPKIDPFSEKNVLIFMNGPLTGTVAPSSGRTVAVSKSPLTGTIFDSYCGGFFGYELRKAGFLGIVIKGKAKDPVYINISREIEILDASDLWGKSTSETTEILEKRHKNSKVACIGVAGENLVRFASIIHDKHRAFGRGGLGAVMGSKNLKAVVVKGFKKIYINEKLRDLSRALHRKLLIYTKRLSKYGTPNIVNIVNESSALPTKNFLKNKFEGAHKISGEEIYKYKVKDYFCYACTVACGKVFDFNGVKTYSLEYETIYAFGPNLAIDNPEIIAKANNLCNEYGMDTISTGLTIASLIEARKRGLVNYEIEWGDKKVLEVIELIAYKKGIGRDLAEGSKRFCEKIGEDISMSVKGLELPGYDPRGAYGMALAYATSNRGGCHLRAPVYIDEILNKEVDRFERKKAEFVKRKQDLHAALDSLILCKFTVRGLEAEDYAKLLGACFGREISEDELLKIGERIFNLERLFNVREGFGRKDDTLPRRLLEEEVFVEGRKTRAYIDLDEYYNIRGWSKEGVPKKEKLEELDLTWINSL